MRNNYNNHVVCSVDNFMKNTLQRNEDKGQNSKVYHFNDLISSVYKSICPESL